MLAVALFVVPIGIVGWRLWQYEALDPLRVGITALKEENYIKALEAIRPFAAKGNANAQRTLGEMYAFGLGVPRDDIQARLWLHRAELESGDPGHSEYGVALGYLHGYAGKQDKAAALKWLQYAAESGYPKAQEFLGIMEKLHEMGFADDADVVKGSSETDQSK